MVKKFSVRISNQVRESIGTASPRFRDAVSRAVGFPSQVLSLVLGEGYISSGSAGLNRAFRELSRYNLELILQAVVNAHRATTCILLRKDNDGHVVVVAELKFYRTLSKSAFLTVEGGLSPFSHDHDHILVFKG